MKMEDLTGHILTPSLFLFKGNLKEHLSFAKYVVSTTVDFLSDLRSVVSCLLKDSIKYYWQGPTSTETPENALPKKFSKEEDQMMAKIRKIEKTEKTCFDPFRVRLSFTLAEKLKMTIFGILLLPIRFISICMALNLGWALSCIGLVGLDINDRPVTGWRIQLQQVISALGRLCCFCFGFQVSKTGTQVITSHSKSLILPKTFGKFLAPTFKLYRQSKVVGLGRSPTLSHFFETASLISASFVFLAYTGVSI